jgi:hypothetical protein
VRNANRGELRGKEALDELKIILFVHPIEPLEVWEHVF